MLEAKDYHRLKDDVRQRIDAEAPILDQLRSEIRPLKAATRRIHARSATALSLVATDGGNNQLRFDPFLMQLIRVVDSNDNEYCIELVSPTIPVAELDARQFDEKGKPRTSLGRLMQDLGISSIANLSHMITAPTGGAPRSSTWVQVYRELVEWAVLLDLLKKDYGSDTLIVFDGDLRSKAYAGKLFIQLGELIEKEIARLATVHRKIFIVGVMKSSQAPKPISACDGFGRRFAM